MHIRSLSFPNYPYCVLQFLSVSIIEPFQILKIKFYFYISVISLTVYGIHRCENSSCGKARSDLRVKTTCIRTEWFFKWEPLNSSRVNSCIGRHCLRGEKFLAKWQSGKLCYFNSTIVQLMLK